MKAYMFEDRKELTPQIALSYLQEGNKRFINALKRDHDHIETINVTRDNQWPFAAVVSCSDSRTSVEIIFDQGLGDLFSVRLAGNVITPNVLGSLEFATKVLGSKLIVVLGHTKCGAVKGACDDLKFGNLTNLLDLIKPAVHSTSEPLKTRNSKNEDFVKKVTNQHVKISVYRILDESPVIKEMIQQGELGILPAVYNIETGKVDFFLDELIVEEKQAV